MVAASRPRTLLLLDTGALRGLTGSDMGANFLVNPVQRLGNGAKPSAWSEIFVQNAGTASSEVTVAFYTDKGIKQSDVVRTVLASGFALFDTRSLLLGQFQGYAIVTGARPLAVQWLAVRNGGLQLAGFNGIEQGIARADWACTDARRIIKPEQSNSLQIHNAGRTVAEIQFEVFAPSTGASVIKKISAPLLTVLSPVLPVSAIRSIALILRRLNGPPDGTARYVL